MRQASWRGVVPAWLGRLTTSLIPGVNIISSKTSLSFLSLRETMANMADLCNDFVALKRLIHCGYRRYLYHQGNEQTTGGTVEAAAKPWLIPAGK